VAEAGVAAVRAVVMAVVGMVVAAWAAAKAAAETGARARGAKAQGAAGAMVLAMAVEKGDATAQMVEHKEAMVRPGGRGVI